jgi:hypothetical protein
MNNIYFCEPCPEGKYSLQIPDNKNITACKICPFEALYCYKNIIKLKNNYWREKENSD